LKRFVTIVVVVRYAERNNIDLALVEPTCLETFVRWRSSYPYVATKMGV